MNTMNAWEKHSLGHLGRAKTAFRIAAGILLAAQSMEGALLDTRWTVSTASGGITSPWIHSSAAIHTDGLVYMGGGDNSFSKAKFYALDPANSQQRVRWTFPQAAQDFINSGTIVASPTFAPDGTIYFGIRGPLNPPAGRFYALNPGDAPTQRVKWQVDTDLPIEASAAIGTDGTIYAGSGRQGATPGRLYAFYPDSKGSATAQEKWRYPQSGTIGSIDGSPSIGTDGTIYFGTAPDQFFMRGRGFTPSGFGCARFAPLTFAPPNPGG